MDEAVERLTILEPGSVFADYRVEGLIDRGGMGVVYRATDEGLNRTVALKIIAPEHTKNPDAVRRFKSEARLAASLEHPNIVPIHRGGEYHGVLYLAMRFVPGTNLRQIIDRGELPLERVLRIVMALASALDAAHERGLVHRDVKPANILISGEGDHDHIYLTDFGLTKRLGSAGSMTRTGAWVGTPDYVAPEQIQAGPVDGRADIYSLGCVLYEMLAGEVAYPKDNDMAKLWSHVQDPCPLPSSKRPELVKAFDDVVARATAKNPDDRFPRASDLAAAVSAAVQEQRATIDPAAIQATRATDADAPSAEEHEVFIAEPAPMASAPPPSAPAPPPPAPPPPPPPGAAPPSGGRIRPQRQGSSRIVLALGVLVGVIVIAVAAVLALGGDGGDEESPEPPAVAAATELPANLDWQPIAEMPFRRQYAASTVVDGKIYVFGGIVTTSSTTTTKIYDPASNRWTTAAGLPHPLHHFTAVTYKGEAVVIGGFVPGDELTSEQTRDVYALREGTWQKLPSLKHPRAAAAAAVVGDKIVVVGGQAGGELVPQTEIFDGERWTDAADIPTPREHLGAASDGRYLYAVGGRELSNADNFAAFERYDPESNRWTELEDMPETVGAVAAAFAGGRIVAVGGEGTTEAFDEVQGYDIKGRGWSQLPPLSSPRHGVSLAVVKDVLYAFGGATEAGHVGATRQSELLDLSGQDAAPVAANAEWRQVTKAPTKLQYAAAAEVRGRVWLFGGIGADEKAIAETAAYDRAINTWVQVPRLPQPVHHAAAVTYRGEPMVIGGTLETGESDRVYALRGDRWVPQPPLNRARAAGAAAVVGNRIIVVGGVAGGKLVPQTEIFDGQGWTEAAAIPTPRQHLGAASDDRYVYAVGGRGLSAAENTAAFERYDPERGSWTRLDPMPKLVGAVGAGFLAGRVIAVGGEGTNTVSDAVQAYDLRRQAWSQLQPLPEPRHGSSVVALGGSLYSIGGAAAAGHVESTQEVYVLDLE